MWQLRSEGGASIAVQTNVQSPSVEDAAEPSAGHFKLKPGPGRSARDVSCHQRARIHSATVEVIAEQGYEATTVRRLARKAGVSTRTFYKHYSGKEECFLRTQELIVGRWVERIAVSRAGKEDGGETFLAAAKALLHAWLEWPEAARLVLVDASSASPQTFAQARYLFRVIAAKCRVSDVGKENTSELLSEGVIAGMVGVMGSRLFHPQPFDGEDDLLNWIASCCPALSSDCSGLLSDRKPPKQKISSPVSSSNTEWSGKALAPLSDRDLVLAAVSKLAATGQAGVLTAKRISKAAGVSQRKFNAVFPSLSECLIAAVESHTENVTTKIRQQCDSSTKQFDEMSRKVAFLCSEISREPALANLCFGDLGMAGAERLLCQEHVVGALKTFVSYETCEIAAEAAATAAWAVLCREVASHRTDRLDRVVPVLTYLLLAPPITTSWATEVVSQRNYVAAA